MTQDQRRSLVMAGTIAAIWFCLLAFMAWANFTV